jgi:Tfp pilus assembly protein PilE
VAGDILKMKIKNRIFTKKNQMRGSMLVELLLSIALAVVIIPFVFQYHQDAITRAENIAITNEMNLIQSALERHIIATREELLKTVGRNITRVKISDLLPYGIPDSVVESGDEKYQLRILKTPDSASGATLQGVVVRVSDDISPLRTRQIVGMSGGSMGFVDGTHAYGTFGSWHTDSVDLGVDVENAIVETTAVNRDNALYLWRVPSDNADDAKMMSALNLGGHDILNATDFYTDYADFSEDITSLQITTRDLIFQNRTSIDNTYTSTSAVVAGMMSSDSKNMEVSGTFSLSDTAKVSSLTAENLWVSNLTLPNINVESSDMVSTLKINQSLDMTSGRIEAMYISVGFAGSMTPRLVVYDRIQDSVDSAYYWDVKSKTAKFSDASFVELNRMATLASLSEGDKSTYSGQIFGSVSANKNATVADFMNAINQIQTRVMEKYQNLQLQ